MCVEAREGVCGHRFPLPCFVVRLDCDGNCDAGCSTDCKCKPGFAGGSNGECTACEAPKYATSVGTASCLPCSQLACPADQYRTGCGGTFSGQCMPCNNNCPPGTYRQDCGGISAGTCSACADCGAGKERVGCSGLSPGFCQRCPTGCARARVCVVCVSVCKRV